MSEEKQAEDSAPLEGTVIPQTADAEEHPSESSDKPEVSIESLQNQLTAAKLETEKYKEQMLRQQAELENVRRRVARDVEDAHKYGLKNIVQELLPIKDSMEMEQAAASEQAVDVVTLREGSALILKMLSDTLDKFKIKTIEPAKGEKFNPDLHEALAMVPMPDAEPNTVIEVHQKGYQLNERLLRPARVIVVAK
jgi:molecular chaperone GrpE